MGFKTNLTFYDFIAAAMISVFVVWLWALVANLFPEFFLKSNFIIATVASYIFYTLCGVAISYLALNKSGSRKITDGFLIGVVGFITSAFYVSLFPGVGLNLLTALLVSFLLGGCLGAVFIIKINQTKNRVAQPSAHSSN